MIAIDGVRGDPVGWLLEPDPANPGVRYFALRDLLNCPEDEADVRRARAAIMKNGPVPAILAAQQPEGYWYKPGTGYSPKYQGSDWQIILLAELGAEPTDKRVKQGCEYLLQHNIASTGAFTCYRQLKPSGAVFCLNGNLLHALLHLGYADDPRVTMAFNWLAQAITGKGEVAFYKSGTAGPGFICGASLDKPCGWGAVKALKALSAIPPEQRTRLMKQAIQIGVEFLFSRDPAVADYPYAERISSAWFKFGFPLSYWSDVLEITAVLAELGYGSDPRLDNAIQFILSKQDDRGRWKLENGLNGKMWMDIEKKGQPSKWVTLRALRVLKRLTINPTVSDTLASQR